MDPKKSTNLTPELKEIYDRVMNTTSTPKQTSTQPVQTPTTPSTTQPQQSTPSTQNLTNANPQAPLDTPQPPEPSPAEDALSSTPPRPLTTGNTFSFNGTVKEDKSQNVEPEASGAKPKSKISLPILIALGVVFIVMWAVLWAIVFGFIKR